VERVHTEIWTEQSAHRISLRPNDEDKSGMIFDNVVECEIERYRGYRPERMESDVEVSKMILCETSCVRLLV